ncbi:MAG: uncharacterized protein PWQ82_961 [Thermosediminibacterales bacterium]|nr:uncharacterized protein [Thermosediminibacterales bacterium]
MRYENYDIMSLVMGGMNILREIDCFFELPMTKKRMIQWFYLFYKVYNTGLMDFYSDKNSDECYVLNLARSAVGFALLYCSVKTGKPENLKDLKNSMINLEGFQRWTKIEKVFGFKDFFQTRQEAKEFLVTAKYFKDKIVPLLLREVEIRAFLHNGDLKFKWKGRVVKENKNSLAVEVRWGIKPVSVDLFTINPGDEGVEVYFKDRNYNIFFIREPSGKPKGWYCNITEPAIISNGIVDYRDLIIDVVVNADGRYKVLDVDEYEEKRNMFSRKEDAVIKKSLEELLGLISRGGIAFLNYATFF